MWRSCEVERLDWERALSLVVCGVSVRSGDCTAAARTAGAAASTRMLRMWFISKAPRTDFPLLIESQSREKVLKETGEESGDQE